MLPFDVKKYTREDTQKKKALGVSQQAVSNMIVSNSFPIQTAAQPIQQLPAKQ